MKTLNRTRLFSFLSVFIILMLCSVTVFNGAVEKQGSITLRYELSDVEFSIYQVGIVTDSGVVCTDQFKPYHVDINSENAAQTLEAYIARNKLEPLMKARTDSKKEVLFDNLTKGVYLTIGESTVADGVIYTVMPSIISIPYIENNAEHWDVAANVKNNKGTDGADRLSVVKVWKTPEGRPTYPEVTVQLLKDGKIYDSVVLNDSNSWKYTWTQLDKDSRWTVTEKEFDADYKVDISENNHIFTITNSIDEPHETTTPGTEPSEPSTTTPTSPTSPTRPGTTVPPKIPQTGQLNWPIPLLCVAGAVLILIGLILMRKKHHE